MHRALPILACLLAAAACRSTTVTTFQEDLMGTCWVLVSLDGEKPPPAVETTLCFSEVGRVDGSGGCNEYFASARFEADRLEIGPVGATRMACDPAVMEHEQRYFTRLMDVRRWLLSEGALLLYGEEPPALRFERKRR
ncbi:MAG: META domain-containing protein [Planctomycetota bacterium]